jgi:hypothetical protein
LVDEMYKFLSEAITASAHPAALKET